MSKSIKLYNDEEREFGAKEITDSEVGRSIYWRTSQRPLCLERNAEWVEWKERRLERQKGPAPTVRAWNGTFLLSATWSHWRILRKKDVPFTQCPQCLAFNRCSETGWMSWDNAYQMLFKQWSVSELTVIIIWRRIRRYPQFYSLRSQSDSRLLDNEGGNLEAPDCYSTSLLLK